MSYSTIEWTDVTDNIIVVPKEAGGGWWCRKVSPACANCYAEDWNRFRGNKRPYVGEAPLLMLRSKLIESWARQKIARKHFVASMTDIAGPWLPSVWIHEYLDGMAAAPLQTFQLLTKHPNVLLEHVTSWLQLRGRRALPANIWVGVTVENQARADELITFLLRIPAAVRFLSIEPVLGSVRVFTPYPPEPPSFVGDLEWAASLTDAQRATLDYWPIAPARSEADLHGIHWVIVGGESGRRARPASIAAMRGVVTEARGAGVAVFVKQLGSVVRTAYYDVDDDVFRERALDRPHRVIELSGRVWAGGYQPDPGSVIEFRPRHRKGADMTEWPEDLRVRELPEVSNVA